MAQSILARMAVQISANTVEFSKAMNQTQAGLKSFTSSLTSMAASLGVAFSARAVVDFTMEVSKLAGEAEGVKSAFDRLENSVQLMIDLKKATNGTVSELDLMKRAVMASNFDISLKALPKLLEFATLRAQQTGQSVDYLVDSIVTGIGRKSKLILDNLGISAVQLDEALGGASTAASSIGEVAEAVGRIAEKNLKNMAGFSENAKTSMDRLTASWENLKVTIGGAINESGITQAGASSLSKLFDVLSSGLGTTEKLAVLATAAINPVGILTGQFDKLFDKVLTGLEKVEDHQFRLSKWDAQLLINKYGGINQAIQGLNEMTGLSVAFDKDATRQLENRAQILGILNSRLKESTDSITRGLEVEKTAVTNAAKAYDELFKSKANLGFAKTNVPNVTNILAESRPGAMPGKVTDIGNLQGQVDKAKELSKEIQGIQADLSGVTADFVASMAETIGASLSGTQKFGQGFLKALAQFGSMFGRQLIALGFASEALKKTFSNPYVAIAAGVALVAASAAIGGSISKFNSNYGGGGGGGGGYSGRANISGTTQTGGTVTFRIEGKDLVGTLEQAQADNRIRRGG